MRLDAFFTSQSLASRKEVREYLKKGLISVNDTVVKAADTAVDPERDIIALKGQVIPYKRYLYLMLNKPQGIVSATEDKRNRTVLDLVPPELFRKGLFPAGRLDKDTVGFVLLTDDGDFAHRILAPKKHVPKTYEAVVRDPITAEDIRAFEEGLVLEDGAICMQASLRTLEKGEHPLVEIVLREGKYHQVKRMFERRGNRVLFLKRTRIGGLWLDPALPPGGCREILHKELNQILELQNP